MRTHRILITGLIGSCAVAALAGGPWSAEPESLIRRAVRAPVVRSDSVFTASTSTAARDGVVQFVATKDNAIARPASPAAKPVVTPVVVAPVVDDAVTPELKTPVQSGIVEYVESGVARQRPSLSKSVTSATVQAVEADLVLPEANPTFTQLPELPQVPVHIQQPMAITRPGIAATEGDLPPLPKSSLPKLPTVEALGTNPQVAKPPAVAQAPQAKSNPASGPAVQVAQENGATLLQSNPASPNPAPTVTKPVELSASEKQNRLLAEQQRLAELQRKNEFRRPQADHPLINSPVVQATEPVADSAVVEAQPTRPAPVMAPVRPAPVVAQKQTSREKPVSEQPSTEPAIADKKPQLAEKQPQPVATKPQLAQQNPQPVQVKPQLAEQQPQLAEKKPQPVATPARKSPPTAIAQQAAPQRAPQPMPTPEHVKSLTTPTVQPTPEPRFAQVPAPQSTQPAQRPAPRVAARSPQGGSRSESVVRMPPFIAQQVAQHVQYGQDLAARGASHSARSEYMRALDVVAHALDAQENSERHREALRQALTALEEADDLTPHVEQGSAGWRRSVEKHTTPILKAPGTQDIHPFMAMQKYCAYAGQRLVVALGNEPSASKALYGMARLELQMDSPTTKQATLAGPRAIVLHQAALSVDSNNFESANELGVLFARYGQYEQARAALLHSIRISPQPVTWQNLASVSELLGDRETAHAAKHQQQWLAQRLMQLHPNTTGANAPLDVTMVDPITFANLPTGEHALGPATPRTPTNGTAQTAFQGQDPEVKKNDKPIVARMMDTLR